MYIQCIYMYIHKHAHVCNDYLAHHPFMEELDKELCEVLITSLCSLVDQPLLLSVINCKVIYIYIFFTENNTAVGVYLCLPLRCLTTGLYVFTHTLCTQVHRHIRTYR